ncbi:hypothetical protein DFH07DRAFT_955538 [Mycena maculata]|uniref:Uncharacterized protein n=1 Tax=Mycena maculata TaxID=230809 RepID=A0AAD7NLR6_9AGAR|nr:hypothetical protein DFH07DRAFT_955538 [Mycena maculata]
MLDAASRKPTCRNTWSVHRSSRSIDIQTCRSPFPRPSLDLTALKDEVANYAQALDLITDLLGTIRSSSISAAMRVISSPPHHPRSKNTNEATSAAARASSASPSLPPVGLIDSLTRSPSSSTAAAAKTSTYSAKSSHHGSIDSAYFGMTFPHLLYLVYPTLIPPADGPSNANAGGEEAGRRAGCGRNAAGRGLNETAKLQEAMRDMCVARPEELEERS